MIRGLYIATSGMIANERMQESISNNIANANTVGYKSEVGIQRSFPEELLLRLHDDKGGPGSESRDVGRMSNGTMLEEILPRFVQGALKQSDNPHAHAIIDAVPPAANPNQRSYFPVLVNNQTMYTRDGDFRVQPGTNLLVTSAGDPVLPTNAATSQPMANLRIRVTPENTYETVDLQGNPYPQPGQPAAAFSVVDIADSTKLNKYGEGYFTSAAAPVQGTGQMEKGQLEQSNVDLASSMVSMMTVMRSYEANQRMIRTMDSTLEKAVSLGRLS